MADVPTCTLVTPDSSWWHHERIKLILFVLWHLACLVDSAVCSLSQTLSWSAPDYCYIYTCQNHVTRVVSSSVCPSLIFLMIPVLVWSRVFCGNYTGNSTNANKKRTQLYSTSTNSKSRRGVWCLYFGAKSSHVSQKTVRAPLWL